MDEINFKILTYLGHFVNEGLLEKGIYMTNLPSLKSKDTTIEIMVKQVEIMRDMTGGKFMSDTYFENLKQCTLLEFKLVAQAE
jgi:hypothetical protein